MRACYQLILLVICISVLPAVLADFKAGGEAYKNGDYETAVKEFLPLAENGDHRAMYALGSMYAAGHGVPRDLEESRRWFSKAARYGRPDAQYKLGLIYAKGLGVDKNPRRAINWFGKSAKQGYGPAQYQVGLMYQQGEGVTQSNIKAYAWLQNAAVKGVPEAQPLLDEIAGTLSADELNEATKLSADYRRRFRDRR